MNLTNSFIGFSHHNSTSKQETHFSQKKSFIQPRPSLTQRKDQSFLSPVVSQPAQTNRTYVSGFEAPRPTIRFT